MKFPWFGRKKAPPLTGETYAWSLSPDIDHTIVRRLYYLPTPPQVACPRCRHTLIQEQASYLAVTFDENAQETDRLLLGGDFGHYCPNCPTVVINPDELAPYVTAAQYQFDSGDGIAVLGRMALEELTEEEQNMPVGELENIPIVPFNRSSSQSKPKNKKRKGKKRRRR